MRFVSITQDYFEKYAKGDREFMQKHGRPCLIVLRLSFRGQKLDFAVPFRSNIAPNVPKDQYFALPPRPTTRRRKAVLCSRHRQDSFPHGRRGTSPLKRFRVS